MTASLKRFTKHLSVSVLMLVALMAPTLVWPASSVSAAPCSASGSFLTFPHWHRGLSQNDEQGNCTVQIKDLNQIWIIVLNITDILLQVVGYVASGFVLYGGIRYILSNGNPDEISKSRDTIIKAMIGMVVAISASAIVGFIVGNVR